MLQYHSNIEYSLPIHFFMDGFIMSNGTKGRTHLQNPVVEKWRFKFAWHFGTTRHERDNKIHVYGYPLGPARNY